MCLAVDATDELVTVQDWQTEIAEHTLRCRNIALNPVVESKQRTQAITVDHHVIKWGQHLHRDSINYRCLFERLGVHVGGWLGGWRIGAIQCSHHSSVNTLVENFTHRIPQGFASLQMQ